jgi:hypothetical protein
MMKVDVFKDIDAHFMKMVDHVLHTKGEHYTVGDDRFSNWKSRVLLAKGNRTHLDECLSDMRKHVVAFFDMFHKYDGHKVPQQKFLEHGGDIINYIRLINGILTEGDEHEELGCNHTDCACHIPGEPCVRDGSGVAPTSHGPR